MTGTTTFDSTKRPLLELLADISKGKIQLPDFQRGWIWDDSHIKSLLASVSVSYPIGAVMLLQTGGEGVRFKPRAVEGTEAQLNGAKPEFLILDGQQRLTSLFQALRASTPVRTKDTKGQVIHRWYYIDMKEALREGADLEDAIVAVPENRVSRDFRGQAVLDLSSAEKEYELEMFPFARIFDSADWRTGHQEHFDYDQQRSKLFNRFEKEVVKRFEQYQVPVISLLKETPKEAVCQVFERVNTGGVSLTVFELLTATFASDDFNLREDWERRRAEFSKGRLLKVASSDDFLQVISLLATRQRREAAATEGKPQTEWSGISCKRRDILRLSLDDYRRWAEPAALGFTEAAKFLHEQRIFTGDDLPYRTQLVPLAAVLGLVGAERLTDGAKKKIACWYWSGVFGELYGGAIESRFAKDLPELLNWISGGAEPSTVTDASFNPSRLLTLRTRNSAAYKGLFALVIRGGGLDLRTGTPIDSQLYFDEKVDIHHIFPRKWCCDRGLSAAKTDCVVNKTTLSAKTNRMIGGRAPSEYLATLKKQADIDDARMDAILTSHVMDPGSLRSDDFERFFAARAEALLLRIEEATGKRIARDLPAEPENEASGDMAEIVEGGAEEEAAGPND